MDTIRADATDLNADWLQVVHKAIVDGTFETKEFDESLHPRDDAGRFGEGDGVASSADGLPARNPWSIPLWKHPDGTITFTSGLPMRKKDAALCTEIKPGALIPEHAGIDNTVTFLLSKGASDRHWSGDIPAPSGAEQYVPETISAPAAEGLPAVDTSGGSRTDYTAREFSSLANAIQPLFGTAATSDDIDVQSLGVAHAAMEPALAADADWRAYVERERGSYTDANSEAAGREFSDVGAMGASPAASMLRTAIAQEFNLDNVYTDTDFHHGADDTVGVAAAGAFAREQYAYTQERLSALGITEVPLMRTMSFVEADSVPNGIQLDGKAHDVNLSMQSLSSFSTDPKQASAYAQMAVNNEQPIVVQMAAVVPASAIYGASFTGMGYSAESEFVVLGNQTTFRAVGQEFTGANASDKAARLVDKLKLGLDSTLSQSKARRAVASPANSLPIIKVDADPRNAQWLRILRTGSFTAGTKWSYAIFPETKEFDESLHPRDEHGKFGEGGGGGGGDGGGSLSDTSNTPLEKGSEILVREAANKIIGRPNGYETLEDSKRHAIELKIQAAHNITGAVKDNPAFKAVRDEWAAIGDVMGDNGTPDEQAVASIIGQWAVCSGDSDIRSVAIQMAAQKEFGLDDASVSHLGQDAHYFAGMETWQNTEIPAMQAVLRAQYNDTQSYLKEQGVTEVSAWRGSKLLSADVNAAGGAGDLRIHDVSLDLQPISSFSASAKSAERFSGATESGTHLATVSWARIPADRILSTPATGFGCYDEDEITVLGGADQPARMLAWSPSYGGTTPDRLATLATGETGHNVDEPTSKSRFAVYPETKDFDESLHPRDAGGKFGEGGEAASSPGTAGSGKSYNDPRKMCTVQEIETARAAYSGQGDYVLALLREKQGFNALPTVTDEAGIAAAVAAGATEMYRGEGKPEYAQQMMTGPLYAGGGVWGNGTYVAVGDQAQHIAELYSGGGMLHMALSADAKIGDYTTLSSEMVNAADSFMSEATGTLGTPGGEEKFDNAMAAYSATNDIGRYATMQGYDAYAAPNKGQMIVLNRGALTISSVVAPPPHIGGPR
jgi:hypothetical protein